MDDRSVKGAVLGSAVLALGVRGLWLAEAAGGLGAAHADPGYSAFVLDSAFYHDMAARVLAGTDTGPYLMAPLYGWFLAGVRAVAGDGPTPVYVLQVIFGAVTAGLAAWLGAALVRPWGERSGVRPSARVAAWTAGLAWALYPVAAIYDARLLSVSLCTMLLAVATALLVVAWRRGAVVPALLGGLVLGLDATGRANLLLAAPVLAIAFALHRPRRLALVFALGFALPIGISAAHNAAAGEPGALVSVNGGINLYRGNNPFFIDEAVHPFRLPGERDALARRSRLIASMETARAQGRDDGRLLSWREVDRYWIERTLEHWRQEPVHYVGLFLRKAAQVLGPREIADNTHIAALRSGSMILRWLPPLWGPISLLGLLGLVLSFGRGRRWQDTPMLVLVVAGVGSIALFFVVSRYRVPLGPLLAAYAGGAVAWAGSAWRVHRAAWVPAGVGLAMMAVLLVPPPTSSWLPWSLMVGPPGPRDPCEVPTHTLRAPAVERRFHVAVHAMLTGDQDDAERRLRALLKDDSGHVPAMVDLSWLLLRRGETWEGGLWAARAVDRDACNDKAWNDLGIALLREGHIKRAADAFEKASRLDPYEMSYLVGLAAARAKLGDEAAARRLLARAARWQPDNWQARAVLARLLLKAGRYDEAERFLDQAIALAPQQGDLLGLRGLCRLGRGQVELARQDLETAQAAGLQDPALDALSAALDKVGAARIVDGAATR